MTFSFKRIGWVAGILVAVLVIIFGSLRVHVSPNTQSQKLITTVQTSERLPHAAALNLQGTKAASIGMLRPASHTIRIWDAKDGRLIQEMKTDTALDVAFSPDGKLIASGTLKGVLLWRVDDGSLVHTFDAAQYQKLDDYDRQMRYISFSPNGQLLAATGPFTVWLWRISDGSLVRSFDIGNCGQGRSLAFSPDSEELALGCGEASASERPDPSHHPILIWRIRDGTLVKSLKGHRTEVTTVQFSPNGYMLASGGGRSDGEIHIWDLATGSPLATNRVETNVGNYPGVNALAFSPDSQSVAYSGSDYKIYLIRSADGALLSVLPPSGKVVLRMMFKSDGAQLVTINGSGAIQTWSLDRP